jgi:hypothetical protein
MAVARVLFLAKYRVPHAAFALQFDHFLKGIDYTIIASPMTKEELEPVWARYNIDSSKFQYVNDSVIYERYPEVNNWVFEGDYRGWWLRQQAIKLAYLDYLDADVMLMQDPDTFMLEPYRCYNNGTLNLMSLMDTTQGSYDGVFESIIGLPRQSPHCFVTELCAVRKVDFVALKDLLERRWHTKKWLDAIIEAVPGMPTIPPWGNGNIIKWFSEYELLGNWAAHCGNIAYQEQRRFEYDTMDQLGNFSNTHNAVCDAVPDLSLSMQMDWETLTIPNFEHYLQVVHERLRNI